MTETTPPTLDMALSEVAAWVAAADYQQALARCNELNAVYPDAVRILRARAQANELAGNFTAASEDYARALDILPADSRLMIGLARCQVKAEQPREAAVIAQQVLGYDPHDRDALKIAADVEEGPVTRGLVAIARSWFGAGLVNRALSEMRRVNQAEPDRTDLQVVLAEMLWRNGLKVVSVELCQSILDEQPDCLNAHVILSELWAQIGNREIAQAYRRNVDRLDPDHRATLEWLGDATPLEVSDVPAHPEPPPEPIMEEPPLQEKDGERDNKAWVAELVASSAPVTGPVVSVEEGNVPASGATAREWTSASAENVSAEETEPWLTELKQQPVKTDLPDGSDGFGIDGPPDLSNLPLETPRVVSVTLWSPSSPDAPKRSPATPADAAPVAPAPDTVPVQDIPPAPEIPPAQDVTPSPAVAEPAGEQPPVVASDQALASAAAPAAPEQPVDSVDGAVTAPASVPGRKRIARRRVEKNRVVEPDRLALARQAIEAGQYEQAVEQYGSLIAADSQFDVVLADLDRITHARPEMKEFHKLLGMLYERKGEVNAALMAYHRALDKT